MFYDNKIIDYICGSKEKFSIEHRSINAIIAAGMGMTLFGLLNNIICSIMYPLILTAVGLILLPVLYYFGRIKGKYAIAAYGSYIYTIVYLSINWFFNGGSYGPTIYFYFTLLIEFTLITTGVKRKMVIITVFFNVLLLFIVENKYYFLVIPYKNEIQRTHDLYSSFFMNVILIVTIVIYIYSGFRSAKEKSEKIIKEKEDLIENIVNMAYYNIITKLPNRKMFERFNIEKEYKDNTDNLYMVTINIENYDEVVSNLSYDMGIAFIEQFGIKMKNNFENTGRVYHFEVHKFGILFSVNDINIIKYKMENMKNIVIMKNITIYSEISVGVAKYEEKYSNTELFKNAENARNYSKNNLTHYSVFDEGMENDYIERMEILGELKDAIKKNELELYFQPKVNIINERKLSGVEALIRWNHSTKGIILPAKFIPYLEETTLINEVTKWVLETSFRKQREWKNKGVNTKIAVNISVTNLYDKEFHFYVANLLSKYNLTSESIEFELTESKGIEHFDAIIEVLNNLKNIGIKISMDDFGTGYSSLSYIKKLPIDSIKIDRIFIKEIDKDKSNQKIVSAAISIAENFGLKVIAEGIETEAEKIMLQDMNCNVGQGYLFAKPMREEEFLMWYDKNVD